MRYNNATSVLGKQKQWAPHSALEVVVIIWRIQFSILY